MSNSLLFDSEIHAAAEISGCQKYRYWLTRTWNPDKPIHAWIMLNPSTADGVEDDPTIRRVMGFSRSWGAGGICVTNLFALRATNPAALYPDPHSAIGKLNDAMIAACTQGRRIIAAWGVHGSLIGRDRAVMKLLGDRKVECLGVTSGGHPRHPLYVTRETAPRVFEMVGA